MDIPSFTHFKFINALHQKNFFAAASCWLLYNRKEEETHRVRELFEFAKTCNVDLSNMDKIKYQYFSLNNMVIAVVTILKV